MSEAGESTRTSDGPGTVDAGALGLNAWLVEEMYQQYLAAPESVSESWREFFADYRSHLPSSAPAVAPRVNGAPPAGTSPVVGRTAPAPPPAQAPPAPAAPAAPAPSPAPVAPAAVAAPAPAVPAEEEPAAPLRGAAGRIVQNMVASLAVPTATSVHPVPAKLLEVNRQLLNEHLGRSSGGKVSFTHLIAWAIVRALGEVPALNASFVEDVDGKGTAGVVRHRHVGLGIAIDLQKADGSRALVVPAIRNADALDFAGFLHAYEDLVRRARANKLEVTDFAGVTATVTNPGTLGTTQSVPRLMRGQGVIVGVGALDFPAEYAATDPDTLAELGLGKVVTLTSTYDHRIIQGAESGLFLKRVHELLLGERDFYDEVFSSFEVPHQPVRWQRDRSPLASGDQQRTLLEKQVQVQALVNMYRVRGHLIAQLDPLAKRAPELRSDLDPRTYNLSVWDLDRRFHTLGLAGMDLVPLSRVLEILRAAYCRTVGVEYMHIQSPDEKRWIQEHVEGVPTTLSAEHQRHILGRLNAAEAFERFLHSRYVGQKRFGLEGAESTIPFLDAVLEEAAHSGIAEAVFGMAHRGRLNVLANIVGKSYGEIFAEFEGNLDPESVQGSGDVKYHKGAVGKWVGRDGASLPVTLASNPSHLEAVDPVVEGLARAKQDQYPVDSNFPVLPVLIHGDAAFAGQGVVAETLNLSQLKGYRTGGTVHLVINNQLGFTTPPTEARSSVYATDVAKMVQAPIFHVNGDDPEACVRVARLAVAYRQAFHKDVVVDLVCYRLHGHNEGDDPSYTQPLMYKKIEAHRSVRKLYTEALVKRGDITLHEAEQALSDFQARLQGALDETRSSAPPKIDRLPERRPAELGRLAMPSGVDRARLDEIAHRLHRVPDGFTVHPKLARQLAQRVEVYAAGEVDWALGEALAFGSLVLDGVDVRLTGQDTRRGTFSQRHSVLVDYGTGDQFVPLAVLDQALDGEPPLTVSGRPGRFFVRDSLLSEYAALGFEYGYSVEAREALVCWEAQFGDFANGAQIIIDNFLVAAEEKWGQSSGLVLLLPHGYEGQGSEHSSARLERFLALAAEGNITVAQPTTAAQYFHLLRSQAMRTIRRPLIVMTPKSLLRARQARSPIDELVTGQWREVLDDPERGRTVDTAAVERIVCCSGKIAFDAIARRDQLLSAGTGPLSAVVRVEQLHPWPEPQLVDVLDRYPNAGELVWVQDEPENMGAWGAVHERLHRLYRDRYQLRHVSRNASGSPATGSHAIHELELASLLDRAVGPDPARA
ncbi:MAG TPA: multifunctional oxoglutarate decarboxylase/oxoglutarate dehydrogenase thiamine pyrophosphate-binding subunit/dihydrolipoyllysine-residue succinyltransferase subunit [Acidimicrobiales bacterium]|nr:multifunctional oxoglutarate decarboxylase/oxoglutarate dehydrogenase thiamine pyrophosphate-binding subunit/dihydrolipoyllysine-residue succinyltransferase subunit [Acidimicrobiales bacterium]